MRTGGNLAAPSPKMGLPTTAVLPTHPQAIAPPSHTATASTSTLCKVLQWHADGAWQAAAQQGADPGLLHQADWLASLLHADRWGCLHAACMHAGGAACMQAGGAAYRQAGLLPPGGGGSSGGVRN